MSSSEEIKVKNLDHLGIVAGLIDEIELVEIINEKIGIDPREKISSGQVVKALILNGLGMVSRPLYLFSQFFEDKAIEKLLGEEIKSEYLNDDKIGRVMDKIYEIGLTNLLIEIGLKVIKNFKISSEYVHLDATSFHVHGEYKDSEIKKENEAIIKERPIIINQGYSRDHHPELKQCMLDLIVSNDGSIPLFMRAGDGNEADKAVFGQILVEFKKQIQLDSIMIADSALYSQGNLKLMETLNWITRVPLTIQKAQEFIETAQIENTEIENNQKESEKELIKELQEKGYRWRTEKVNYGGVEQRWLIVESAERKRSDEEKLLEKIQRESEKVNKLIKKLESVKFEKLDQAKYELKGLNKKLKFFLIKEKEIVLYVDKKQKVSYQIKVEIEKRDKEIEAKKKSAGRFIIATNILDETTITSARILEKYKEQSNCERGFKFLKDPLFFADSFFVEKPERVETILFLMSLCLLIYNLGQRELRNSLKRANTGVKNQVNKLTNRPTLRWIFQSFQGIHLLIINDQKSIINLTQERRFILDFLPSSCQKYYL